MKKERGVSLSGLLMVLVLVIAGAITAFRLIPAFIEFSSIKKSIATLSQRPDLKTATPTQIRQEFDKTASVSDIHSIAGSDLDITKDGNNLLISVSYPKKIGLGGNVSLLIDFVATSAK